MYDSIILTFTMANVMELVLNAKISTEDILLWLNDVSSERVPSDLRGYNKYRTEFVPLFLNLLRNYANKLLLLEPSVRQHSTVTSRHFPMSAIKYISPCKSQAFCASRTAMPSRLDFAEEHHQFESRCSDNARDPYDLEAFLAQETCETSLSSSQKAFPKSRHISPRKVANISRNETALQVPESTPVTSFASTCTLKFSPLRIPTSTPRVIKRNRLDSDGNVANCGKGNKFVSRNDGRIVQQRFKFSHCNDSHPNKNKSNNVDIFKSLPSHKSGESDKPSRIDINDSSAFPPMDTLNSGKRCRNRKKKVKTTSIASEVSVSYKIQSECNDFNQLSQENTDHFSTERQNLRSFKEKTQLKDKSDSMGPFVKTRNILNDVTDEQSTVNRVDLINDSLQIEHIESESKEALNSISNLYAALIIHSHVPSLVMELEFLLQLLTIRSKAHRDKSSKKEDSFPFLASGPNLSYLAARVLCCLWQPILAVLDRSLLRLLSDNKMLQMHAPELHAQITSLLSSSLHLTSPMSSNRSPMKSVAFQADTDNRMNFPDDNSFRIFRKQRDEFYELLRDWERNHSNSCWSMTSSQGPRIRHLLDMAPSVCNIAHFARLFVLQLLCLCDVGHILPWAPDDSAGNVLSLLRKQHPEKFSRLQQRLVTPSRTHAGNFPSFPGVQQFFRGFLLESNNASFNAHLEDNLVNKIFELLDFYSLDQSSNSRRGAPSVLLRRVAVIAKFLGLMWFSPYTSSLPLPQSAVAQQVLQRSKLQPRLSLCSVLRNCASKGELLPGVVCCVNLLCLADDAALHTIHLQTVVMVLIRLYKLLTCCCASRTSVEDDRETSVTNELQEAISMEQEFHCSKTELGTQMDRREESILFQSPQIMTPRRAADEASPRRPVENFNNSDILVTPLKLKNCDNIILETPRRDVDVDGKGFRKQDCHLVPSCRLCVSNDGRQHIKLSRALVLLFRLLLGELFDHSVFPDGLFYTEPFDANVDFEEYVKTVAVLEHYYSLPGCSHQHHSHCRTEPASDSLKGVPRQHHVSVMPSTPVHNTKKHLGALSPSVAVTFADSPLVAKQREVIQVHNEYTQQTIFDETVVIDETVLHEWCPQLMQLKSLLSNADSVLAPSTAASVRKIIPFSTFPKNSTICSTFLNQEINDGLTIPIKPEFIAKKPENSAQKDIQQQLEESFFHQQPNALKETIHFVIEQLFSNSLRNLRCSVIPSVVAEQSQLLREQLEVMLQQQLTGEMIESLARARVQHFTEELRKKSRLKCFRFIESLLDNVKLLLRALLPADIPEQVLLVCCGFVKRNTVSRMSSWMSSNLTAATPATLLSNVAVKIVRAALRELSISEADLQLTGNADASTHSAAAAVLGAECSALSAISSSEATEHKDHKALSNAVAAVSEGQHNAITDVNDAVSLGLQPVSSQQTTGLAVARDEKECLCNSSASIDVLLCLRRSSAMPPSLLMAEMKNVALSIVTAANLRTSVTVKASTLSYLCASCCCAEYKERTVRGPPSRLEARHMLALMERIQDSVRHRDDLSSPLLNGLKALSVDIVVMSCAVEPRLAASEVLKAFVALWKQGAALATPTTLSTSLLAPRIFHLIELVSEKVEDTRARFANLELLIKALDDADLLDTRVVQDAAVALFRHTWTQEVLSGISNLVQLIGAPEDSVVFYLPSLCQEMELD